MRRLVAAALTLTVAAACAGPPAKPAPPPADWRWESYGGVEVRVPGDWRWGNGTQRLGQWCIASQDEIARPMVGRPGYSTLVGCSSRETPRPETTIAETGTVVAFDRTTEGDGERHEGDQTAVRLKGVLVTVNAPRDLRERIVETIRPVDVDSFGCPSTHVISTRPGQRPAPVAVTSLREVSSVSVCKYGIASPPPAEDQRLFSAARLDGTAAARAVQAIAEAPIGGGPDDPDDCLPEYAYGDEVIVLLVRSAAGLSEVVVRYSGCDHNGFDDGLSVRSLTPAATGPLLAGPNAVVNGVGLGW